MENARPTENVTATGNFSYRKAAASDKKNSTVSKRRTCSGGIEANWARRNFMTEHPLIKKLKLFINNVTIRAHHLFNQVPID